MKTYWYYKIQDICTQAQTRHKRITATWIQKTYTIPYSTRTICKVMHQVGCMSQKRKKYQQFYQAYSTYRLPRYKITARCVRTGALFFSHALK